MDEKKETPKCSCGEKLHLHNDSMATISAGVLTYSCPKCGKKWEQTAGGEMKEAVVPQDPCEGCYSYGKPSAMMRNCPGCYSGSMRNKIF